MNTLFIRAVRIKMPPDGEPDYSFDLPCVRGILQAGELAFNAPITFLVGENGAGKSTLLEAMAVAWGFNPEGGTRNFNFSTQHTHSPLHSAITLVKGVRQPRDGFFLRAESFYNFASEVDRMDEEMPFSPLSAHYGGQSLHRQSHGESFMALVNHRFCPGGLYILDEPEAALSPMRQMALLLRLHDLAQAGAQVIAATHSPLLICCPGSQVLQLEEGGIASVSYDQTEHFKTMRRFMDDPQRSLHYLLQEK